MFLPKTPYLATRIWPRRLWRMPASAPKSLYLTFDDGPTPGVTDWVLEQLDAWDAKATFFVVGAQVVKHPELFRELYRRGHSVGNHTQTHPNGWKTASSAYLADVERGAESIRAAMPEGEELRLFRPPYGRIRSRDAARLGPEMRIVMWDVVAGDWMREIPAGRVLGNVVDNGRPGSIVVLHDSLKSEPNLRHCLPRVLEHFAGEGYVFKKL